MFTSFFKTLGVGTRTTTLAAPMAGHVIPLSEVEDQMFAKGLLGQGVAMVPTGDRVVAPSDGKIEGLDVLIHVGLETVKLDGRHFKVNAAVGDIVKRGDVLIEFDREAISKEGYDLTVPILICNSAEFASIKGNVGEDVEELGQLLVARSR